MGIFHCYGCLPEGTSSKFMVCWIPVFVEFLPLLGISCKIPRLDATAFLLREFEGRKHMSFVKQICSIPYFFSWRNRTTVHIHDLPSIVLTSYGINGMKHPLSTVHSLVLFQYFQNNPMTNPECWLYKSWRWLLESS